VEPLEERRLFVNVIEVGPNVGVDTVKFTDADGTRATIRAQGAGGSYAFIADLVPMQKGRTVTLAGTSNLQSVALSPAVPGTTIRSFTISGKGGNGTIDLPQTSVHASVGLFGGKLVHLTGQLDIQGTCGRLLLDAADEGSAITLGATEEIRISHDSVANLDIGGDRLADVVDHIVIGGHVRGTWNVDIPVRSVLAAAFDDDWDGEFDDVGSFRSRGDFLGDIDGRSFRGFYVGSRMSGVNFGLLDELGGDDDYALRYLTVKKEIDGVVISSVRSLGDVRAGGIQNSLFFVGIDAAGLSPENRIPNTPQNFERNSQVRSITISARSSVGFSDSVIGAKGIGDLRLGRVSTDNGGRPFGIGTTMVRSASGILVGSGHEMKYRFTNLASSQDVAAQTAAQGLQTGDFYHIVTPAF
jgi:hypothetical protein